MRKLSFSGAIKEALYQEMERDSRVFVYGIGVPDHKAIFGTTSGLKERFGERRCFDTPLCEDTMTGFGIGAAITGLRPIHIHIRVDFLLLAMNQLANMMSTMSYLSSGRLNVPMVVRAIIGRGWGQGAQHSKSMQSVFAHIPGLKVVMPTTPADAKGMLIAAIRDPNPVLFLEHRWLHFAEDDVPEEPYEIALDEPAILRTGSDITILATSWMVVEALQAADILHRHHGLSAEVIAIRSISPFNPDLIVNSVRKTHECVIADNDWVWCGFSAELSDMVNRHCFGQLNSPVDRMGFAFTPCPTVRHLENCFYQNAASIVRLIEEKRKLPTSNLENEDFFSHEKKFRGPF